MDASSSRSSVSARRTLIGAASSIGIRPYDSGREPRHLDRAPAALRARGLVARLQADDLGDLTPTMPYRDFVRPPEGVRNEDAVAVYSRALAERVGDVVGDGRFAVVLGGDCSIVLGSLSGARRTGRVGLAYVDAHADFCTPTESQTGSAASMCLALAVGRGDSPLARLAGSAPLVDEADVVLIGRRDGGLPYGHAGLAASQVLDLPAETIARTGLADAAATALERLARPDIAGFWIHIDADVLDPSVMPAVDSPEPDGLSIEALVRLVTPLSRHPRALGMQLTIYDPALDPDRLCAERLSMILERILTTAENGDPR